MEKESYVYILASQRNGTLNIGVTSDLVWRTWEHREGAVSGFSAKYGCKTLVYFEVFNGIYEAIRREKALKEWKRSWKLELIEHDNPTWRDLWRDISSP